MNNLLKSFLASVCVLALLLAPSANNYAQDNAGGKPAILVSIASIEEQFADIEYLLTAAGQADAVPLVTLMGGAYVDGLDKTKPIGGFVNFRGEEPRFVAFLPIVDLDRVLERISQFTSEPEDAGDDVLQVSSPDGQPVFIKQQGGWAFVTRDKTDFAALPEDPTRVLGELPNDYNFAVALNVGAIPQSLKDKAIEGLKEGFEESLSEELVDDDDPATREMTEKMGRNAISQMTDMIEQTDQLTFGWSIDRMAKTTHFDFTMTANAGTKMAQRMAMMEETTSGFTGFLLPNAAATLNFSSALLKEDTENVLSLLNVMQQKAQEEIEKDDDLDEDELPRAKKVLDGFFEIVKQTMQSGKIDGGGTVILEPEAMTVAAGGYVADGAKIAELLEEVAELAKDEPDFPGIKFDAEQHGKVSFHTMTFPVPEGEEEARKLLGDQLDVAIGIGAKSAYLAFGKNSVQTLKQVIDQSAAGMKKTVPPAQFNISLTPIIGFAASVSDDQTVTQLAEQLQGVQGNDQISMTSKSIKGGRGYLSRIELGEGVLQAIGVAVKAAQQAFAGGGQDAF